MTHTAPRPGTVEAFLDALTPLLVRRFREGLYERLQPGCPEPVTDGTYPLLSALTAGPASAAQVATRVGVDRTVITKQATTLQAAGLLGRRPDPSDARATLLELTPHGRDVTASMRRAALDVVESLGENGIDDETLTAATRALAALGAVGRR